MQTAARHLGKLRALPKSNQPQALTVAKACLGCQLGPAWRATISSQLPAGPEHILAGFAAWTALAGSLTPHFPPGVDHPL